MNKETSISRKAVHSPPAVHRPSDVGSSSTQAPGPVYSQAHNQPQNHWNEQVDEHTIFTPPPYSGPTTPFPSTQRPAPTPRARLTQALGIPPLRYSLYRPQHFTLSSDHTTITSRHELYSTSPSTLCSLIQELASVPPKPIMRIVGQGQRLDERVDFDVKINCTGLFFGGSGAVGQGWHYVKMIGEGELGWRGGVKEESGKGDKNEGERDLRWWAERFCKDDSTIKQFTLTRTTPNWSTSTLHALLLSLIATRYPSYRGRVNITFPITHSSVTVHSPDKVNRFLSHVTKVFTGVKKYEVVKSVWPYASGPRGEQGRQCVVVEEEEWFEVWKEAILKAVKEARKGWVGGEDLVEAWMDGSDRE